MLTYQLRPVHQTVTAARFTASMAEAAIAYANASPSDIRDGKIAKPELPPGVSYSPQGSFLLDVPGEADDLRLKIGCYIVRDSFGVVSTMEASDFEERYTSGSVAVDTARAAAPTVAEKVATAEALLKGADPATTKAAIDVLVSAKTEPAPELPPVSTGVVGPAASELKSPFTTSVKPSSKPFGSKVPK